MSATIPPPSIRTARRTDVPAIVRLLADDPLGATRENASDPLPQPYWDAFDAIESQWGNELLVAESAGDIIGCLQLTIIPGLTRTGATRAQIEGVRVSARHRGQKIGEQLIETAIERARKAGCTLVQLTTDRSRPDAHRFYERLGFVASHIGMKRTLE
jgi:ribosomal protein S18 acetylase RimI-like enzyme